MTNQSEVKEALARFGYQGRAKEILALTSLYNRPANTVRALLITGAPGTGKTFLAETLANMLGAEFTMVMCHSWLSDEELVAGVNLPAFARALAGAGEASEILSFGALARWIAHSARGTSLLLLDEIDKAPERVEALLLYAIERGALPLADGSFVQTPQVGNLWVVATSNGRRPLIEATLRRFYRMNMDFLPPKVEAAILRQRSGASIAACKKLVAVCNHLRASNGSKPSLNEMVYFMLDAVSCESARDVRLHIESHILKTDGDVKIIQELGNLDVIAESLWGELRRKFKFEDKAVVGDTNVSMESTGIDGRIIAGLKGFGIHTVADLLRFVAEHESAIEKIESIQVGNAAQVISALLDIYGV